MMNFTDPRTLKLICKRLIRGSMTSFHLNFLQQNEFFVAERWLGSFFPCSSWHGDKKSLSFSTSLMSFPSCFNKVQATLSLLLMLKRGNSLWPDITFWCLIFCRRTLVLWRKSSWHVYYKQREPLNHRIKNGQFTRGKLDDGLQISRCHRWTRVMDLNVGKLWDECH